MKQYKKIVGALLALGIGSGAQAATYEKVAPVAECVGENVTVPCEQQGWHVGAQYIYVQPTGDQLYSDLNSQSRWASGFRLEGGYHFGTGNDVTVNWIYFSKSSRRNVVPFNNPLLANSAIYDVFDDDDDDDDDIAFADIFGNGPFTASEQVKSTFNAVNLEFGQMAYWGERVSTRFHVGLQYASIKRTRSQSFAINGTGVFTDDVGEVFRVNAENRGGFSFEQKFRGIGPRVGVDAYYTFGDSNFSLVGKTAVAVLAADTRVRKGSGFSSLVAEAFDADNEFVERLVQNVDVTMQNARTRTLTLGLEAKLGLEYAYPLASGDLVFEGGYQWAAYPQAMLAPSTSTLVLTQNDDGEVLQSAPINLGLGVPGDLNNFGYHGFYVGLRWNGDLA
jgi:Legionella pneumophila major outer membrane protein precursor